MAIRMQESSLRSLRQRMPARDPNRDNRRDWWSAHVRRILFFYRRLTDKKLVGLRDECWFVHVSAARLDLSPQIRFDLNSTPDGTSHFFFSFNLAPVPGSRFFITTPFLPDTTILTLFNTCPFNPGPSSEYHVVLSFTPPRATSTIRLLRSNPFLLDSPSPAVRVHMNVKYEMGESALEEAAVP